MFEELAAHKVWDEEILDIAVDVKQADKFRVAIGTKDQSIQLWTLGAERDWQKTFQIKLNDSVPKALRFSNKPNDPVLYVMGMTNGKM